MNTKVNFGFMRPEQRMIVEAAITAYCRVFGDARWEALTAAEQHDVIMAELKGFYAVLERFDEVGK